MGVVSISFLGFLLGLRHALDADHIAAVSTIVYDKRGVGNSSLIGLFWGMGHTATLMAVGIPVLLFHWVLPAWFGVLAETGVGIMLLILGGSLLFRLIRDRIHWHQHAHEGEGHVHAHSHLYEDSHQHAHLGHFSRRSFTVGTVHGLAGSGALLLLMLGTISSALQGVAYLILFSAGVTAGMMLLTYTFSIPISWKWRGRWAVQKTLTTTAGVASIFIGTGLLLGGIVNFRALM